MTCYACVHYSRPDRHQPDYHRQPGQPARQIPDAAFGTEDNFMRNMVFAGIFTFGLAAVFLGVMLCPGKFRWIYAIRSIPVYAQREVANLSIPIGLGLVVVALMVIRPGFKDWLTYPLLCLFSAYVVLAIWQLSWMKPA